MNSSVIIIIIVVCLICSSILGGVGYYMSQGSTTSDQKTGGTAAENKTGGSSSGTTPPPPAPVTYPWSSFTVGQAVNCNAGDPGGNNTGGPNGGGGAIYRYVGNNTISGYPDPGVAASWDPKWQSPSTINCTGITQGPVMAASTFPWTAFNIGQAVNCNAGDPMGNNSGAIYRYTGNNTISHYPNPTIAGSWDSNWNKPATINCTGLTKGADMATK